MIDLGTKVVDKVSGFKGIAVSRTEYMNGCTRYAVQGKVGKDGKLPDLCYFDEGDLTDRKSKPGGYFSAPSTPPMPPR